MAYTLRFIDRLDVAFAIGCQVGCIIGLAMLAVIAVLVAFVPHARAEGACFAFTDGQQVVLRGTIVQSATTEGSEGVPPHKFMAITLNDPICPSDAMDKHLTFFKVSHVHARWLGHDATITGNMALANIDGSWSIMARRISDNGGVSVEPPAAQAPVVTELTARLGQEVGGKIVYDDPKEVGSALTYANGIYGVSYDYIPAISKRSRVGDPIRLCLVSVYVHCPKGDDRGKTYAAVNLRTGGRWALPDAEHRCGGA